MSLHPDLDREVLLRVVQLVQLVHLRVVQLPVVHHLVPARRHLAPIHVRRFVLTAEPRHEVVVTCSSRGFRPTVPPIM